MIKLLKWLLAKAEKHQHKFCNHDYQLTDSWSSDALGVPYGYKTYKCSKCKHIDKQFWYV